MEPAFFGLLLTGFLTITQGAHVEVEPREVLVLPGQNVSAMCRVAQPLQYCRVEIPGMKPLNLNTKFTYADVSYYGAGLPAGQCGFTINRVAEQNNGNVQCTLGLETDPNESVGTVKLVVARAPKLPELDLSRGADSVRIYRINERLEASCIVRDGRPVANISWFLGAEPLYRDELSMATVIDLAKENLQSKLQNLTRILQASDNGKDLRCVAHHPAYPEGRAETSRRLDVHYAPLPQGDLDKFGYTIGQAGVISVIVEANPKPKIEWDIGGERLKENDSDQTGRIEAEAVKQVGNGKYEVSLRIASIQKQDTERTYTLTAYNLIGTNMYTIKISTSPEPEGLELGIGGIIGIIIAVLFILLTVFIVIFAKVTGRWCFSGRQDTRNLGESSDTESADVRPRESRPFTPIKFTTFFKKNKDKVASTEDVEPKKIEDEVKEPLEEAAGEKEGEEAKEGLVYAELDLVSPQNVKPVVKSSDDKTEYAEIVYPSQPEGSDKKA